jgi:myo-inositol 2-dehydrogenase/D-chiro-inositol 1-dehydrogenase
MHQLDFIGAGRIGKIHAANAWAHPALAEKYVTDPIIDAAEELASSIGAQVAAFEDVIADPSIAGIVVASSTDTHLDFSIRTVEAGKAVFCEKPIDLDLAKARAAAPVLGASGSPFFVGFNRRFDPHFAQLHERLLAGEMGALETLHIISHDPVAPPIAYVRVSGGLFRDMAIHDFDMARWLLDEEPTEVFAAGACLVDPAIGEAGDIDTAKTMLRTQSGKVCVISNSRRSGYGYDQRIEAFCARGLLRAGNVRSSTVESWDESGANKAPLQNFFLDRYADAYRAEMSHFAELLSGSTKPLIGYSDGIWALAIAEAAMESHKAGRPVRIQS